MPKSLKVKVGNKAKSRQHVKSVNTGYYSRQALKTEANRRSKRLKHLRSHPNDAQTGKLL